MIFRTGIGLSESVTFWCDQEGFEFLRGKGAVEFPNARADSDGKPSVMTYIKVMPGGTLRLSVRPADHFRQSLMSYSKISLGWRSSTLLMNHGLRKVDIGDLWALSPAELRLDGLPAGMIDLLPPTTRRPPANRTQGVQRSGSMGRAMQPPVVHPARVVSSTSLDPAQGDSANVRVGLAVAVRSINTLKERYGDQLILEVKSDGKLRALIEHE